MDDVASEAGVGKAALYRYFRDKEDLYAALVTTATKQLLRVVEEQVARGSAPETKLKELVATLIDFFDDNPYFFDLVQHVEALSFAGRKVPWARTRQAFLNRVAQILHQGVVSGDFAFRDTRLSALMLLGAIRAVVRIGDRPRPPGLATDMVEQFLHGAHSPRSGRRRVQRRRFRSRPPTSLNGRSRQTSL